MHGSIWPQFHQHAWGYFAFKHLLRCSDDRTLPLVKKICDSIGFEAANRLWLDKVWTAGCFLCVDNWIDKCLAFIDISILFSNACNARDVAKEKLSRLFTELHLQNYSMSLFSRAIWTGDKLFFICPTSYPHNRTTSNNPHPRDQTAGLVLGGNGNRSNWTMHHIGVSLLILGCYIWHITIDMFSSNWETRLNWEV